MGGEREETLRSNTSRPKLRTATDGGDPTTLTAAAVAAPPGSESQTTMTEAGRLLSAVNMALTTPAYPGDGAIQGFDQQDLVTHVNSGQIHFHDRARGLKAAVPVGDFYGPASRLRHLGSFTWLDTANKTLLVAFTRLEVGDSVRLVVRIAPCDPTFDPNLEKLERTCNL